MVCIHHDVQRLVSSQDAGQVGQHIHPQGVSHVPLMQHGRSGVRRSLTISRGVVVPIPSCRVPCVVYSDAYMHDIWCYRSRSRVRGVALWLFS